MLLHSRCSSAARRACRGGQSPAVAPRHAPPARLGRCRKTEASGPGTRAELDAVSAPAEQCDALQHHSSQAKRDQTITPRPRLSEPECPVFHLPRRFDRHVVNDLPRPNRKNVPPREALKRSCHRGQPGQYQRRTSPPPERPVRLRGSDRRIARRTGQRTAWRAKTSPDKTAPAPPRPRSRHFPNHESVAA